MYAERRKVPPDIASELLGAVNAMRVEMDRRFKGLDDKLDAVCEDVSEIKLARAVESGRAEARDQVAQHRMMDGRSRLTLTIAAVGAVASAVMAAVAIVGGRL
jgi:hypothetical protein